MPKPAPLPSCLGTGNRAGPGPLCGPLGPGGLAGFIAPSAGVRGEPGLALDMSLSFLSFSPPSASEGEERLQPLIAAWGSARLSPYCHRPLPGPVHCPAGLCCCCQPGQIHPMRTR